MFFAQWNRYTKKQCKINSDNNEDIFRSEIGDKEKGNS
jgi:hypothetical protein